MLLRNDRLLIQINRRRLDEHLHTLRGTTKPATQQGDTDIGNTNCASPTRTCMAAVDAATTQPLPEQSRYLGFLLQLTAALTKVVRINTLRHKTPCGLDRFARIHPLAPATALWAVCSTHKPPRWL